MEFAAVARNGEDRTATKFSTFFCPLDTGLSNKKWGESYPLAATNSIASLEHYDSQNTLHSMRFARLSGCIYMCTLMHVNLF